MEKFFLNDGSGDGREALVRGQLRSTLVNVRDGAYSINRGSD